ncbi:Toll/interleukin-1 receptor domain-containing protein [Tanacetum coccineum]
MDRELAARLAICDIKKRNEDLKILAFDTTGMNPEDATRIEALKDKARATYFSEDTRHNFVSHLYKALEQQGILTYKDDEKIKKGETIDTQLIESIEESRFFIIVFSKDYMRYRKAYDSSSDFNQSEDGKIQERKDPNNKIRNGWLERPLEVQDEGMMARMKEHESKLVTNKHIRIPSSIDPEEECSLIKGMEDLKMDKGDVQDYIDNEYLSLNGTLYFMKREIHGVARVVLSRIFKTGYARGITPVIGVIRIDLLGLYKFVDAMGGYMNVKVLHEEAKRSRHEEQGNVVHSNLQRTAREDVNMEDANNGSNYEATNQGNETSTSSKNNIDELVKIMECRKASEQTAYPVFYDVDPTEIRKQSGAVEKAFEKHENKEAARKWRKSLSEAGNLTGWESKKSANGSSSVDGNLVGMETSIEALLSSLELDAPGFEGSSKEVRRKFEGRSFVDNVREVSKRSLSGLKELQKQILTDVFSDQNITVSSVYGGKNKIVQVMRRKKVLVILDDVDCTDQLEALAGDPNWYKPGSRIIITTRNEQVLVAHRVGLINNDTLISHTEAIRLFNRIKVLGSLLCGQNEPEWKDALERLKTIPLEETMKILELSYDALDDDYKEIFLDVACLLKGRWKDDAVIALESCGFHARNGLRVLGQRLL